MTSNPINVAASRARDCFPSIIERTVRARSAAEFHQLVCASSFKFVSGTITPQHAKTAHSDGMGPGNVMPAVPDHQTAGRREIMLGQNMGEQFRLVIQLAARH